MAPEAVLNSTENDKPNAEQAKWKENENKKKEKNKSSVS